MKLSSSMLPMSTLQQLPQQGSILLQIGDGFPQTVPMLRLRAQQYGSSSLHQYVRYCPLWDSVCPLLGITIAAPHDFVPQKTSHVGKKESALHKQ